LSDISDHIPGLSREGWAMWLVMALKSNNLWRNQKIADFPYRVEVQRRFDQLKKFGCNPDEINEYFALRLDGPAPQLQQTESRPGFEPGTYSHSISLGSDIGDKLLIAYQCYRLGEEA